MKTPKHCNTAPLRFTEIKYFCNHYPFVILKNKNGFVTMMKSKVILNTSAYINTDLTTSWSEITGVTWFEFILISMRITHADKL
jgi:hypothetical protein